MAEIIAVVESGVHFDELIRKRREDLRLTMRQAAEFGGTISSNYQNSGKGVYRIETALKLAKGVFAELVFVCDGQERRLQTGDDFRNAIKYFKGAREYSWARLGNPSSLIPWSKGECDFLLYKALEACDKLDAHVELRSIETPQGRKVRPMSKSRVRRKA